MVEAKFLQTKDVLYRFSQGPDGRVLTAEEDNALSQQSQAPVRPEGPALQSLDRVSPAVWTAVLADTRESVLTVEIDATIIEAASTAALWTYKKVKGFQPQMAFLAELELWIADEFRGGQADTARKTLPMSILGNGHISVHGACALAVTGRACGCSEQTNQ